MRHIGFLLVALLVLPCAALAAPDVPDDPERCAVFGKFNGWTPSDDAGVRVGVEEFKGPAGMEFTRILTCTSESERAGIAYSYLSPDGVFVVALHGRFARTMAAHVRTVIAHEVAHYVTRERGGNCDGYSRTHMPEDHILCEYDTDRAASQWVGRDAVLAALRDTIVYLTPAKMSGPQLVHFARRIQLLEWYP